MDNKIGETVIFTKDLHCAFCEENIELLKVYSFSKKAFDNCENWSGDGEDQCYKVADFVVEVSNDKARFFYAESIQYGFYKHKPYKLCFLPAGTCPIPEDFEVIGSDSFEQEYKVPGSMWDFGMFIDNFLFHVSKGKHELRNDYIWKTTIKNETVMSDSIDELPF